MKNKKDINTITILDTGKAVSQSENYTNICNLAFKINELVKRVNELSSPEKKEENLQVGQIIRDLKDEASRTGTWNLIALREGIEQLLKQQKEEPTQKDIYLRGEKLATREEPTQELFTQKELRLLADLLFMIEEEHSGMTPILSKIEKLLK